MDEGSVREGSRRREHSTSEQRRLRETRHWSGRCRRSVDRMVSFDEVGLGHRRGWWRSDHDADTTRHVRAEAELESSLRSRLGERDGFLVREVHQFRSPMVIAEGCDVYDIHRSKNYAIV